MNKRLVCLIMVVLMALGMSGWAAGEGDRPVLTVSIADNIKVEDFDTNAVTKYIEETLGVDLQFNVYASADYRDKMMLVVNSGDKLDDIIIGGFTDTIVYEWAKDGSIAPLTEYYAKPEIAVNLYDAMERVGYDFRGSITMPDGEIYYIPTLNQSYGNECQSKMWYYAPWLEELGVDVPDTTEEFEALLRLVVESDVNGNDIADEVGIAGYNGIASNWFSYLMNAFVYTDFANMFMKVEDGELSYSFTEDAWREGVEWIASLISEGLIPTETVTQDMTAWKTMINTTDVTALTFGYLTPSQVSDTDVKSEYIALPPIAGPDGVRYTQYNPSKASCSMVITSDCENVELAFRVGDLMVCEELSIVARFGARGQDWDYLSDLDNASDYVSPYPGFDAYIVVYNDANFWGSGAPQGRSWMQAGPFIRQYGIANGMGVNPATVSKFSVNEASGICLYQQGGYFPDETVVKLIYNDEETAIVNDISSTLSTLVNETTANWLLGNVELNDESWQKFLSDVEAVGGYDYLACAQAAYSRSVG